MNSRTIASSLLAVVLMTGCVAAPSATAPAERVAAQSASFDADGLRALEAAMKAAVDEKKVHGVATRLVKDGRIVHELEYGLANVDTGTPISKDTIYRIYSMSKPIAGVALMTLYEDGAFELDDPVTKFVPELAGLKVFKGMSASGEMVLVNVDRAPTMREVMSHTAGFAYGLFGDDPVNRMFAEKQVLRSPDLDTYVARLADVPLLFQPATDWAYSTSVDLQGYIVQKLSGKRYGEYLQDEVFGPLGMVDTGFFVPEAKRDRFAQLFTMNAETGKLELVSGASFQFREGAFGMEAAGHGLVSTMDDYARFCQMLANGGALDGARILKPETVALMRTNVLPPEMGLFSDGVSPNPAMAGHGFGLDFGVYVDPGATGAAQPAGSYYWGGAAGTWFWIDPVNDLFFIGMIQRYPGSMDRQMRKQSADLVYQALVK